MAMATAGSVSGAGSLLLIQRETWQADSREDVEQTPHPKTEVVCPGDLQDVPIGILEDPLGELVSVADFLLSLVGGPQGAHSWELVAVDRVGGSLSVVSRDIGDIEALPLGSYTCRGRVEVVAWDFGSCGTRAGTDPLGNLLLVQYGGVGHHQAFEARPLDPVYFITQETWGPIEGILQHMIEIDVGT